LHVDFHPSALQTLGIPSKLSLINTAGVCFLTLGLGNTPFLFLLHSCRQECHLVYSDLKVDVVGTLSLLESWHVLDFLGTTQDCCLTGSSHFLQTGGLHPSLLVECQRRDVVAHDLLPYFQNKVRSSLGMALSMSGSRSLC